MNEQDIKKIVDQAILDYMQSKQFAISKIPAHTHNGVDTVFVSTVNLPKDTPIRLGVGGIVSTTNIGTASPGSINEQLQTTIATGRDIFGQVIGTSTNNLLFNFLHQPQNPLNQSFITATRPPTYASMVGSTTSTTLGGNTITINGYNFAVNSLAGALIDIYDSSEAFIETQTIASNTLLVVTIAGTWVASTTGSFVIFQPVFFGAADTPYQRFYTQEGTGGGVRFGPGPTAGGQNGLLYMDATGDLYWRDKGGTSIKLN